ncbi:Golgi transport complex subunit 3 [Agyrium rufum]|nr:Golgi transport complex subunit 3 [Agyrium rufum]
MYEDASYYSSYVEPPAKHQSGTNAHRRKSLLMPLKVKSNANGDVVASVATEKMAVFAQRSPPQATLNRRAESFADFYHAAERVLGDPNGQTLRERTRVSHWSDVSLPQSCTEDQWSKRVEDDLLEARHNRYSQYQRQLESSLSYLDSLSFEASSTLQVLSKLSGSFKSVEARTIAFHKQCEDMITEERRSSALAGSLSENLQYYGFLEPITKRLNAPGAGSFVRSFEFSDMLARLDECLEYMQSHPSHREASMYKSRYRLLLTRGLTLIRVNFVSALREISHDITRRIADKQLNETTMSTLLYAKFRLGSSELKVTAQEIKKRALIPLGSEQDAEAEYQSLMNELYTNYSAIRGKLVLPLIWKKLNEAALAPSTSTDLVAFSRTALGYMRGICSDEFELWGEWFDGVDGLYDYLETLCEPLNDCLRPRIIHEADLLKLCELCTLIQTRYFRESDDDLDLPKNDDFDYSPLVLPILEDSQTRLVFRTQAILRDDIENFKPKPNDLCSPITSQPADGESGGTFGPVMSGKRGTIVDKPDPPGLLSQYEHAESLNSENALEDLPYGLDNEISFDDWYPTLRKAIWLLSRIYRLVNSAVFDDLAHQIVHHTTLSLTRGSQTIITMRGPKDQEAVLDSHLFLLKHFLILKQQIVAFDIEYVTADVSFDFSGVTNTFYELRERGGLFDPRNLWRLVGGVGSASGVASLLPRVVENMLDAKVELDTRLRGVITDFTTLLCQRFTAPIDEATKSKKNVNVADLVKQLQFRIETGLPKVRTKMSEWIEDDRTRETLIQAIQEQVVQAYEGFVETWQQGPGSNNGQGFRGRLKVTPNGKGREDEVWDSDTFADWCANAFRVGRSVNAAARPDWEAFDRMRESPLVSRGSSPSMLNV